MFGGAKCNECKKSFAAGTLSGGLCKKCFDAVVGDDRPPEPLSEQEIEEAVARSWPRIEADCDRLGRFHAHVMTRPDSVADEPAPATRPRRLVPWRRTRGTSHLVIDE